MRQGYSDYTGPERNHSLHQAYAAELREREEYLTALRVFSDLVLNGQIPRDS